MPSIEATGLPLTGHGGRGREAAARRSMQRRDRRWPRDYSRAEEPRFRRRSWRRALPQPDTGSHEGVSASLARASRNTGLDQRKATRPLLAKCATRRLPALAVRGRRHLGRCYSALGSGYSASGRRRWNGRYRIATGDSACPRLRSGALPYPALGPGACVQDRVRRFPIPTAQAAPPDAELAAGSTGDLGMAVAKPSA